MSRELDFDNLSDDDKTYLQMRGNVNDLRRAGLIPNPDFDLTSTPDSMLPHEIDGTGEPTFDLDSAVAKQSVGEPGAPENTILPSAAPPGLPEPVAYKPDAAPAAKTTKAKA